MATPYSRDGRDYYATPDGKIVSVEAGFDTSGDYPDLMPAGKDQVDENDYARAEQKMRGPSLRGADGEIDPDTVFGQSTLSPEIAAMPYNDETFNAVQAGEEQAVDQFAQLEPAEPEAAKAFSRDGRDYYFDGKKLVSVDAGFDPGDDYPELVPADAEEVRQYELQKRSGDIGSRILTVPETARATVATMISGVAKAVHDVDPRQFFNVGKPRSERWHPDHYLKPEEFAPDVFTPEARDRREANPASAFVGAAVPDIALNFAFPGAGVETAAARLAATAGRSLPARFAAAGARAVEGAVDDVIGAGVHSAAARQVASGIVTEAGASVIEGHEFDLGTALGVWAPTQLVFEVAGNTALKGAAQALGWSRNAINGAVARARTSAAQDALNETDPARQAVKLAKNAPTVYAEAQTGLDEALGAIDDRIGAAPDKLFTRSALKRTVSTNLNAQADRLVDLATQLAHAAEVTGAPTLEKAARLLDGVRGSGGPLLYDALRKARQLFTAAADDPGWASYALDNPLVRETIEQLDKTLTDETVWGRAAKNYADVIAEANRGGVASKFDVRDLSARDALVARIDQARRVASLTGDKQLARDAEKAAAHLDTADKVTGARLLNAKATPDEVATMRKTLDAFPERAPKIGAVIGKTLDTLDELAPGLMPDAWTAERAERLVTLRAAGSKAAKREADEMLARGDKWVENAKRSKAQSPATIARVEAQLNKLRASLDEVDSVAVAAKTVRDFDAAPRNLTERVIDIGTGKAASAIASRLASTASGAAAGFVGGGTVGGIVGAVGGEVANKFIEPAVRARMGKFGSWLKESLRKHGAKGAGVAAFIGANELATDEDDASPSAAAAVGLLGVPLFFTSGGKKAGLLQAMRLLDERLAPLRGKSGFIDWDAREPILRELFGAADAPIARLADDSLEKVRSRERWGGGAVDLNAPNAEKVVEHAMREQHVTFHAIDDKVAAAKKAFTAEQGRQTKARKLAPKQASAAADFGELGGKFADDTKKQLKKRVQDPEPFTLTTLLLNDLRAGRRTEDPPAHLYEPEHYRRHYDPGHPLADKYGSVTEFESDERKAWFAAEEKRRHDLVPGLKAKVDAALRGIDPADRVARVTVEDDVIRTSLREALGMRAKTVTRAKDMATDATSRYRKAKAGFDRWREEALEKSEWEAARKWQTMRYRAINADTRYGDVDAALLKSLEDEAANLEANGFGLHANEVQENLADVKGVRGIAVNLQSVLNKAVAAGKNVPGRVTRGIAIEPAEVERLLKAKTATAQGFMSTSIHSGTPKGFAERRAAEGNLVPVMLTVEQRTGVPIGQGEGELTLRPGTKFDVVWAQPAGDDGVVTAYLRETGESTVTPADVLKGIAGKIPTEAKIAGGLLALGGAEALDDEENDSGAAMASVGALALLFGGRGKARLFNEQRIILGKKLPAAARAVADRYIERKADTIEKFVRWAATAERGPLQRGEMSLRNHIVDSAIIDPEIEALGRTWPNGPRADGFVSPYEGLDKYVKAAIDTKLAESARRLPVPPTRNTRKNVGALLEAEASAVNLAEAPLHKRYPDTRVKGTEARFEKSWTALQDQLQKDVDPGLGDIERDYEATNRLAEISNAIDEALGDFDSSHKLKADWQPGPGKNAPADDRLMRAAAGDSSVDLDQLEVDMFVAARENVERKTGRSSGGLDRTPKLGDFIEQRIDWAIASAAQKAREKAAKDPTPGLRGRGLAIRHGGTDFFNDGWAENVRHAAKTQHTYPEGLRDIKQRAIQRLNSFQVDLPKGQASAVVDDLIEAAMNGDDIEQAVEDIARLANEGAEGVRVAQHRRLADTFKRFTETASYYLGFDVDRAIADYAGDFDYKHINKFVRTGDAFGSTDDIDDIEEAAEVALGHTPEHQHAQMRRDDITRKAERLQLALDYAVVNGYTAPGKTWRGVLMTDDELTALQTSDVAEAKSFMSTSADETYPMQFISGKHQLNKAPGLNKVVFEVQQRSGVPVNPGESEVLLRAGSRFRVERINDPDTRAMFRLTEIDADHAYAPSQLGQRIGNKALPWVAGGALLLGGVNEELERQQAEDADRAEADRILTEAQTQAATINETREQQLDETREKLAYLSHQGRTLMQSAARTLAGPANDNAKVERVPGVTSSAGVARFLGSHSNLNDAFEDKRRTLAELKRDPMALVDDLSESFGELQDTAPELHAQVVQKTFQIASFLQEKVPVPMGASLVRPEGVPTNSFAVRQFALYYSAATDPASVITDLANNRARKEQVDTLRQVWPDTYQQLKVAVLERMSEKRPTVQQRIRLDLLFDFGAQFDRALSPQLVSALDAYRKASGEKGDPGGTGAPPTTPSRRSQPSVVGTGALNTLALGPARGPGMG